MDSQSKFIEMIEDLTKLAKINNRTVSVEFLNDYFKELELKDAQMEMVYNYLIEHNIKVLGYDKKPDKNTKINRSSNDEYKESDEFESEYLDIYIKEVKNVEKTAQITQNLLSGLKENDENAREEIIKIYLPKVIRIAEDYKFQGVAQSDLIQEGNIGLLVGIASLSDCDDINKASNILEESIRSSMIEAIDELSEHKKSNRNIIKKADMVKEKAEELAETMNDKLIMDELAEYMDMDLEEIKDILRITGDEL